MSNRRVAAIIAIAAITLAACSGSGSATTAPSTAASVPASVAPSAAATGCKVGLSWFTYQEERYKKDEAAIKKAVEAGGGTLTASVAEPPSGGGATKQASDVETLISSGVDVLMIDAFDDKAILPSVEAAITAGIPVIAYDRLIENPKVLYLTHDNVEVGRMIAREVMKQQPTGNYAIIKGDKANPNVRFLNDGFQEILAPALASGAIKVPAGADLFTDAWKPENAQTNMDQILTANNDDIQGVLSQNDGMAGGVIAALALRNLDGKVIVGGQDGDKAALNRVALGKQAVSVWKNTTELGTAAGEAALALCKDKDISKVPGTAPFKTPGGNTVTANLLKPIPITKENLQVVLDAGWIDAATLCKGVTAGSVPGC
jgi:D-xylose transport system substrate-binding protein